MTEQHDPTTAVASRPKESVKYSEGMSQQSMEKSSISSKSNIDEDEEDDRYHLSGIKLGILIFGLGMAVFVMALDMAILTTAIPYITAQFHSTEDIGWYLSSYSLTLCSLQPLGGKLYSNFSLKWTFLGFFAVFEIGSIISGAATSSNMLIIGRAIAGCGAAGLMSGSLAIIAVVVSMKKRPIYLGIMSSLFGISAIAGPLIGGAFTEHATWRWVFYINLPIGGITILALVFFFVPPARPVEKDALRDKIQRLDIVGAALFIPAIVMLLLALQWGGITYPWSSSRIIGLFIGGAITILVFAAWQYRMGPQAMLPSDIVFQRSVFWAAWSAMLGMCAQIVLTIWIPEWFQVVKNATPSESGVRMLPTMLAQVIASIGGGILTVKVGYTNPWLIAGPAIMSIGSGLFSTFQSASRSSMWIGYEVLYGIGSGFWIAAPLTAIQAVLPPKQTPVGISTITFFQMFGAAISSAISQTIFNEKIVKELVKNAPDIDIPELLAAGTAAVRHVVSAEQLPGVLLAYNNAILSTFYFGAATAATACLCSLGVQWVSVKGKEIAPAEA